MQENLVNETARVMQVAIAPVFLISGVAALMGSMTVRYGRVIDRVRVVLKEAKEANLAPRDANPGDPLVDELQALYRRAKLLRTTIIFASASIFCVSLTIFFLFANLTMGVQANIASEVLFVLSLLFLTLAIALFIEDFALSLKVLKLEVNTRIRRNILQE